MIYVVVIGGLSVLLAYAIWCAHQFARASVSNGKVARHYQHVAEQHAARHADLERAYNDLWARAYVRDAQGRMRHAKDVLK